MLRSEVRGQRARAQPVSRSKGAGQTDFDPNTSSATDQLGHHGQVIRRLDLSFLTCKMSK